MPTTPPPDYTTWSPSDLIKRVTDLEAQLRTANTNPYPTTTASTPSKKKNRKPDKPFDASRYHTRLIALKFAYLGGNYNGFEHHVNNFTPLPTIEEEVYRALRKTRLIFPDFEKAGCEGLRKDGREEVCWEGVEYSKCGRTDRGVSAFGQVIGVKVRSQRPKDVKKVEKVEEGVQEAMEGLDIEDEPEFDSVRDELPYVQLLNRVLPPDIRMLAWCPAPPTDFSARFNCKERRYRYFFTNPSFAVDPSTAKSGNGDGLLDIEAMREAASKYIGLHDFRNFCKIDASKQITNFQRRIFHAGIHEVVPGRPDARNDTVGVPSTASALDQPKLYYFEVRGSAFLWHQVRHLVAVLFFVGQGYESPSIIDKLLDVENLPGKPHYEMASDAPLVLWDCIFPDSEKVRNVEIEPTDGKPFVGYEDSLNWVRVGEEFGGREKTSKALTGKYGHNGIMDELWSLWRQRKIDEVISESLMSVVAGYETDSPQAAGGSGTQRVFDGSDRPRPVGNYVPIMQRKCMETANVVNARYAERKGLTGKRGPGSDDGGDE